jgi:acetoin utilization deacetylase AcuC-like enzyme
VQGKTLCRGDAVLKIFYIDSFFLPLPVGHSFPLEKYRLLRERLLQEAVVAPEDLYIPHAATDEEILRVHDHAYLHRVETAQLTSQEIRRIGFPWSKELVVRARRSCGATIETCRAALEGGIAVHLAGGTHHAFQDRGEGYCVFNDSAVASRTMQAEGRVKRVVILDCDVHKGNGTAAIFSGDTSVFTFSIHGRKNFPFDQEKSDLDIALEDGADDAHYLEALEKGVRRALHLSRADLAIYLAGADPYGTDKFGRLSLTKTGLAARDSFVFQCCRIASIPVAVTLAGGYAKRIEDTVDIHLQTVKTAVEFQKGWEMNTKRNYV